MNCESPSPRLVGLPLVIEPCDHDRLHAAEIDTLLARSPTNAPSRKLLKHLASERDHVAPSAV